MYKIHLPSRKQLEFCLFALFGDVSGLFAFCHIADATHANINFHIRPGTNGLQVGRSKKIGVTDV